MDVRKESQEMTSAVLFTSWNWHVSLVTSHSGTLFSNYGRLPFNQNFRNGRNGENGEIFGRMESAL